MMVVARAARTCSDVSSARLLTQGTSLVSTPSTSIIFATSVTLNAAAVLTSASRSYGWKEHTRVVVVTNTPNHQTQREEGGEMTKKRGDGQKHRVGEEEKKTDRKKEIKKETQVKQNSNGTSLTMVTWSSFSKPPAMELLVTSGPNTSQRSQYLLATDHLTRQDLSAVELNTTGSTWKDEVSISLIGQPMLTWLICCSVGNVLASARQLSTVRSRTES
jgi:hypothetical protein